MMVADSAPYRIQPALKPLSLSIGVRWRFLITGIGPRRVRAATLMIHGYLLEFNSTMTRLSLPAGMVKGDSSPAALGLHRPDTSRRKVETSLDPIFL